jgi:hypothetical protein
VAAPSLPHRRHGLTARTGQPGRLGDVGQQSCTGVGDDAPPVGTGSQDQIDTLTQTLEARAGWFGQRHVVKTGRTQDLLEPPAAALYPGSPAGADGGTAMRTIEGRLFSAGRAGRLPGPRVTGFCFSDGSQRTASHSGELRPVPPVAYLDSAPRWGRDARFGSGGPVPAGAFEVVHPAVGRLARTRLRTDPVEIRGAAVRDRHRDHFRSIRLIVRMHMSTYIVNAIRRGLQETMPFGGVPHASLPAECTGNRTGNLRACGEPRFDKTPRHGPRNILCVEGDRDLYALHIFDHGTDDKTGVFRCQPRPRMSSFRPTQKEVGPLTSLSTLTI